MTKAELIKKYKKLRQENAELEQENAELIKGQAALELQVKLLLQERRLANLRRFGSSAENSSQFVIEMLFNEAEAISVPDAKEPDIETITYRRKRADKAKREIDLSGLETEEVHHKLDAQDCTCPVCQGPLHDMGTETSSELIFVPAKYIHRIHHIHKYSCRACDVKGDVTPILQADFPIKPIPYSVASPPLLAHIATEKYVKALPLYRQEQAFRASNLNITRQTMANWMIKCANWFEAIYGKLHKELINQSVIHADETTVQVLHEEGRDAKQKSYMWLYRSAVCEDRQIVLFDYQISRAFSCVRDFLQGFSGICHADGYKVYRKLKGVTLIGCWAHARSHGKLALMGSQRALRW